MPRMRMISWGRRPLLDENSNGISASLRCLPVLPVRMRERVFEGTIQMKGDKFTLVTPDALTWF